MTVYVYPSWAGYRHADVQTSQTIPVMGKVVIFGGKETLRLGQQKTFWILQLSVRVMFLYR